MTGIDGYPSPRPRGLEVQWREDGDEVVLMLRGEVDLASAPGLEHAVREAERTHPSRILIDLRELDFMDATGLAVLVRAQQSARANGHVLALRRGPARVHRLFELTGLADHLPFLCNGSDRPV